MVLAALDPALLVYRQQDWEQRRGHWLRRTSALAMHRRMARLQNHRFGVTQAFVARLYESFPWNSAFQHVSELKDLRQFMLEDLAAAHYVDIPTCEQLVLLPNDLTCSYVEQRDMIDAWKALLHGCIEDEVSLASEVCIATWESPALCGRADAVVLTIHDGTKTEDYEIALLWSENCWEKRINCLDAWPDLETCVNLYFTTNVAMHGYSGVRTNPIPFDCTDRFWNSVNDFCQPQMRLTLVKAIAKKVYGILDASLGDEAFGSIRRFRVTSFWRIHYRDLGDRLVLDEFGEHNMGI